MRVIHLGYVYANDPTMQTARLMARGALNFTSLMRRWIGDAIDAIPVSEPFYYVVHRAEYSALRKSKITCAGRTA